MIWGIVAARLGDAAKKRLDPILPPALRRSFSGAMLEDVLGAMTASRRLGGVAVLAGDADAERTAASFGALAIPDASREGLNAAVFRGAEILASRGASAILVAMGDLPCLSTGDVDQLAAALPARGGAAAPSRDGTGTNLLALRPPAILAPSFGKNSLAAYRALAQRTGTTWREVDVPGAALDVDTPDDLLALLERKASGETPGRALSVLLNGLPGAHQKAASNTATESDLLRGSNIP